MFLYNVTIQVEAAIETAWLHWLQTIHIPDVMASGCFTGYRLHRLLDLEHAEGPTYTVQYLAAGRADYERYISDYAPALRQAGYDAWGNRFVAFRTLMETIE